MADVTRRLALLAFGLLGLTIAYNFMEGVVAVASGLAAGSLTLIAFGGDSYVEVLAAAAVFWRLSYRDEDAGDRAEQRAMRLIGMTFLLLAAVIAFEATLSLAEGRGAEASLIGISVLVASLLLMPLLSFSKLWLAARSQMPVLAAEAKETLACSYLSLTALTGVVAIALLGWWWLDAVAALLMVPWLVREGLEGLRLEPDEGESGVPCFCRACLYGLRRCRLGCCAATCC
jgi:divalent metal cation (Fe/Co/Zn/Cd) transporter